MFGKLFKKKVPPPADSKSAPSLFNALGPYRSNSTTDAKIKNKIKRPYKAPGTMYALVSFLSCIMTGISGDAVHYYFPQATATPAALALAFMSVFIFCLFQASSKWKH